MKYKFLYENRRGFYLLISQFTILKLENQKKNEKINHFQLPFGESLLKMKNEY